MFCIVWDLNYLVGFSWHKICEDFLLYGVAEVNLLELRKQRADP